MSETRREDVQCLCDLLNRLGATVPGMGEWGALLTASGQGILRFEGEWMPWVWRATAPVKREAVV